MRHRKRPARFTARFGDRQADIDLHPHPTDSLLTCEECGATCAGDAKAMADFVTEHTARCAKERHG